MGRGFKELVVEGNDVDHASLIGTFFEIVYEFSSQAGILEQNKSAMHRLESEIDQLTEQNKYLQLKADKSKNRTSFEKEIQELEKMSKKFNNKKFKKEMQKLKNLIDTAQFPKRYNRNKLPFAQN